MNNAPYIIKRQFADLPEIEARARELLDRHGLKDWGFVFRKIKRVCGQCMPAEKKIMLSLPFVERHIGSINDEIEDTLLHEIAHALNCVHKTGRMHDKAWKQWCAKVGAVPLRVQSSPKYRVVDTETREVIGAFQSVPPFADCMEQAMVEGREETLGRLAIEVLDGERYLPEAAAPLDVSMVSCSISGMAVTSMDGTNVCRSVTGFEAIDPAALFDGWKHDRLYVFEHAGDEVAKAARAVFGGGDFVQAAHLAFVLTGHALDPATELYAVRLSGCMLGTRRRDAIAFLRMKKVQGFAVAGGGDGTFAAQASCIRQLVSGCLVFDAPDVPGGCIVSVFGLDRKTMAAMHLVRRRDAAANTEQVMNAVRSFVKEDLPETGQETKARELQILQNACDYIRNHERFDLDGFVSAVAGECVELKDDLECSLILDLKPETNEGFDISPTEALRQNRKTKRVIRLDDSLEIRVHGDMDNIEKEFDSSREMQCYKIYFEEEK